MNLLCAMLQIGVIGAFHVMPHPNIFEMLLESTFKNTVFLKNACKNASQ